ncbi:MULTISPECIES: hypothetical protein [Stutzerimonas]|uniref:hypothetical protein n=1 Tax=Stutzerimonas TaxID=2901164 RepID=UPI000CC72920|nr:hypothetical protein [Stutzerimonas kunmingensis]PKM28552.1 MAG: hypothetical protein CVV07_13935 [Gammaproteobacteria bacterium HGW-Gammaproteobacteria-11]
MPLPDQSLNIMASSYITQLLIRKAEVSIEFGRLIARQPNGKIISQDYLKNNSPDMLREILNALEIEAYEYRSYKTGHYGSLKHAGIALQFSSVIADESTYTIFNVGLTRIRTTKSGKAGSPLPKGHFIVTERGEFYKFWKSTALAVPKSLTSFHDYMGNLKGMLYTSTLTEGRDDGRMVKGSIRPLFVSADLVKRAFLPDNSRITAGYGPDNHRIKNPDRDLATGHALRGFQPKSTTGDQYYGKAVIRKSDDTGPSSATPLPKRPQDQTVDEWTDDFCSKEM